MNVRSSAVLLFALTALVHAQRAVPPALLDPALRRLPTGSIRPTGWLLDELTLQAKGISGQLPYFWRYFNASVWVNESTTKNQEPHQFVPYYINGLVPLSYQVDDANIRAVRDRYLEHILAAAEKKNVTADGGRWLGRDIPRGENPTARQPEACNYWSMYPAVLGFEQYAEAVKDSNPAEYARVIKALVLHHRQFYAQLRDADPPLNISRWGALRYEVRDPLTTVR